MLFPLAAAATLLSAADNATVNGKWQLQVSAAGRESSQECSFTQKDTNLTGTCNTRRGTVEFNGKVEGKKVTFTYKTDSEGGPVTVVFRGNLDSATKMSGSVTAVEYGVEGEFSGTQSN